jgi:hypothetical protein
VGSSIVVISKTPVTGLRDCDWIQRSTSTFLDEMLDPKSEVGSFLSTDRGRVTFMANTKIRHCFGKDTPL